MPVRVSTDGVRREVPEDRRFRRPSLADPAGGSLRAAGAADETKALTVSFSRPNPLPRLEEGIRLHDSSIPTRGNEQ